MKKMLFLLLAVFSVSFAYAEVNLNTATAQELQTVKGIGPARAEAIIRYRTENGPFKAVSDLQNIRGIGKGQTYEAIAAQVGVGNTPAAAGQRQAQPATRRQTENQNAATGNR